MIPHVRLKAGAGFPVLAPAGIRILSTIDQTAQQFGIVLTVTSGSEPMGRAPTDPHPLGEAVDVSVQGLTTDEIRDLHAEFTMRLGSAFTVLYETPRPSAGLADLAYVNPKATGEHFHLQRKKGTTWP